jgi:hypothetical protein
VDEVQTGELEGLVTPEVEQLVRAAVAAAQRRVTYVSWRRAYGS